MAPSRGWTAETRFVTSPYRVATGDWMDPGWAPYGPHHLRTAGGSRTLCGLVAFDWPIFWDLAFEPHSEHVCRACSAASSRDDTQERAGSRRG